MFNLTHQERQVIIFLIILVLFGFGFNQLNKKYSQVIAINYGDQMIDLNLATRQELISVPGIGRKTAERIIEYRRQNGKFNQLRELRQIKGISESKYALFKEYFLIE